MTSPRSGSSERIRVLLAEDDENARVLFADLLSTFGHLVVAQVASGRDAIAQAKELAPDVVLLDVHMPDGSGIEAAEQITRALPGTAVVLVTGDESLTLSDREVMATSAIAFLSKPVPPRVLDHTLRLAARRARELVSARAEADDARQQLELRKVVERAKGVLMRRMSVSEQEAYRLLQRTSQDRSMPMAEVARRVLEGEGNSRRSE